jgi:hypothetical protein
MSLDETDLGNLGPQPNDQPGRFGDTEQYGRFASRVLRIAYKCGKKGIKRKRVLGPEGELVRAILWDLEMRIAFARKQAVARRRWLDAAIASIGAGVKKCEVQANGYDQQQTGLQDEVDETKQALAAKRGQVERLPRGQRAGRGAKIEAGVALGVTGIADSGAFILTLNGIGGTMFVRLFIALGVVAALNMAVLAVSRMLEGLWRHVSGGSRWVSAAMIASVMAMLMGAIAKALASAGDYRREATANIAKGFPTNPEFLLWTGLAAALGSTVALALWHYASEGNRLMKQVQKLERSLAALRGRQRELVALAAAARDRAVDLVASGQRMRASLGSLSSELSHQVDELRARSNSLVEMAAIRFEQGRQKRARKKEPPPPTFDQELDAWLRGQIDGLGGDDPDGPPSGS